MTEREAMERVQQRCDRYCMMIGLLEATLKAADELLASKAPEPGKVAVVRAEIAKRRDEVDALFPETGAAPGQQRR